MRNKPQRFSSSFPGGWPGIGLLILRAAIGATAVIQGALYAGGENPRVVTRIAGLLEIAGGSSVLIGFLTPVACVLVGLAAMYLGFSPFPTHTATLFAAWLPTILTVGVAAAVVFLGPGALSLDARRLGRREIIIPRAPPRQP